MSNASQPKATLASDGPQPAAETKSQPDQKKDKLTREELEALFEAAQKRASEMTAEEIMKKNSWSMSEALYPLPKISQFRLLSVFSRSGGWCWSH